MWIFLRDSFLSITQHETDPRHLQVRARIRGDIERVFPEADVAENERADYRFSATVSRERAAQILSLKINQLDYTGLKGATEDPLRKQAYIHVWETMFSEQARRHGDEVEPLPPLVLPIDLSTVD